MTDSCPNDATSDDDDAATTTVATPPPITLTKDTRVSEDDLIPIDENCWAFFQDGVTPRGSKGNPMERGGAGVQAKSRTVRNIIKFLIDLPINQKQLVIALRDTSKHEHIRRYFVSAGLIDNKQAETDGVIVDQLGKFIGSSG